MNLYLIHCGFYDDEISEAIYEFHINIPVVAESIDAAKIQVRTKEIFQKKKMHIDGIQEIQSVDGYQINLIGSAGTGTLVSNIPYRDL